MKNSIILFGFLLISSFVKGQNTSVLDTIYANDKKNVALFFPAPIRQGITGSENFVFTYNREKGQYFGLLQAKPGAESNLLVISDKGAIFSYILRYKEQLNKLNHFITESKAIGNEKQTMSSSIKNTYKETIVSTKDKYYQRFCAHLIKSKQRFRGLKKKSQGMVLSIENIVFDKNELYFVIEIRNNSSLDYDLNFLNLTIQTRKRGKKKSLQSSYQQPTFVYNVPSRIASNRRKKLVYVFSKFSISNERHVVLDLNEQFGERNLKVKVSHKRINKPN